MSRLITTEEAIEQFGVSRNFIERHAKLMGNFSRPRRLDPSKVQAIINKVSAEKQAKAFQGEINKLSCQSIVEETLKEVLGSIRDSRVDLGRSPYRSLKDQK